MAMLVYEFRFSGHGIVRFGRAGAGQVGVAFGAAEHQAGAVDAVQGAAGGSARAGVAFGSDDLGGSVLGDAAALAGCRLVGGRAVADCRGPVRLLCGHLVSPLVADYMISHCKRNAQWLGGPGSYTGVTKSRKCMVFIRCMRSARCQW